MTEIQKARLLVELDDLSSKIGKLDKFIKNGLEYSDVDESERKDLGRQLYAMEFYEEVLKRRIERLEEN
jgi:hypothetical protein